MSATQIILLERVDNLGQMGDVVTVKPGYARNYLFPQKKALRASKHNLAYFEGQRKALEAENEKKRKEAETLAKKLEGLTAPLIRAASEGGQLYGSVNSRDIAQEVANASGEAITRNMVDLNQNYKTVGLFPVEIVLHPEVKVEVTINIARSNEEAKIQAETGKALIAEDETPDLTVGNEETEAALEEALEEEAFEAAKEKQAEEAEQEAEEAARATERAAKKAAKEEAKAEDADVEELEAEAGVSEDAAEETDEDNKSE